jgi:hypothetical protein
MLKPKFKIFTPNVFKGDSHLRYRLYRHTLHSWHSKHGWTLEHTYSASPNGKRFSATYIADDCGLGCRCAAFLTPATPDGYRILAKAQIF